MAFLEEFKIFIKNILHWIYSFVGLSLFLFFFGSKETIIFGKKLYLPLPSENSFSVEIFNKIRHDILPPGVQLVATNLVSAFVSQMLISFLLGFLLTIPFLIYKIITYIHPALIPREKRAVLWSLLPFVFLFFAGSVFSYFFIIPATFKFLYPFATVMGAIPFFSINEFIQYVFSLVLTVGIMFLLPLFIILLSFLKIIKADFWGRKWRYALLFFLILSAIITPDGTGITMIMLFLPLTALYFTGYFFAKRFNRNS